MPGADQPGQGAAQVRRLDGRHRQPVRHRRGGDRRRPARDPATCPDCSSRASTSIRAPIASTRPPSPRTSPSSPTSSARPGASPASAPTRLIFGSGFGIPYLPGEAELDHAALPALREPDARRAAGGARVRRAPATSSSAAGWSGPAGWLLTGVISGKTVARGRDPRLRRGLQQSSRRLRHDGLGDPPQLGLREPLESRGRAGAPTCWSAPSAPASTGSRSTSSCPRPAPATCSPFQTSGAYGLTASPTRFISHPEPREAVLPGR